VDVPEDPRVTLVGDSVQVRPVEGDMVSVRETVPVKPWRGATVIVAVPAVPELIVTDVGLAVTVKSFTVRLTDAE
jgi:hypothetical protein